MLLPAKLPHRYLMATLGLSVFFLTNTHRVLAGPGGGGTQKVMVCHYPPGNPANFHTITISASALSAHLAHGDVPGPCENDCNFNNGACDDGNLCTADICDPLTGQCLPPTSTDCNDNNSCTSDSCNPATGICVNAPQVGSPCDDGDDCTHQDACTETGSCAGDGIPGCCHNDLDCADFDPCTIDACDGTTRSCQHEPVACNDGDVCTIDACNSSDGSCVFASVLCPVCTVCGPTGNCVPDDSLSCDDGNPCTDNEVCLSGVCVNGVARNCDDQNPCTVDSCIPGGCQNEPGNAGVECRRSFGSCDIAEVCDGLSALCPPDARAPDGTSCDDDSACNGTETCFGGSCIGSGPLNCNDGNPCTIDFCHECSGCYHEPASEGGPCNDFNPATCRTTCQAGACVPTPCPQCRTCGGPFGGCLPSTALNGTPCDDGDPCSVNTVCLNGFCNPGTAIAPPGTPCDDRNPCTANDTCEQTIGLCVGTPLDGTPCDDGNPCTQDDTCYQTGFNDAECLSGFVAEGTPCGAPEICGECLFGSCYPRPVGSCGACGDGTLNAGEECDDGNDLDCDGCSSACTIEP